jgi:hypothetical protein
MTIDINNDPHAQKRGDLLNRVQEPSEERIAPGRALSLTADARVVEADDPDAEMVFVGAEGTIPKRLADELGIAAAEPKAAEETTDAATQTEAQAQTESAAKTAKGLTIQREEKPATISSEKTQT